MRELGRNCPQTVDELMKVVANYAAGEEAVGTFFSHENDKGKVTANNDEGPSRGSKKSSKKIRKLGNTSVRPSTMISSLQSSARSLEGPQRGLSSTRCSRSPALTTREGLTTSSRIAAC